MGDLIAVLSVVGFFALAAAYVTACGRLTGRGAEGASVDVVDPVEGTAPAPEVDTRP